MTKAKTNTSRQTTNKRYVNDIHTYICTYKSKEILKDVDSFFSAVKHVIIKRSICPAFFSRASLATGSVALQCCQLTEESPSLAFKSVIGFQENTEMIGNANAKNMNYQQQQQQS